MYVFMSIQSVHSLEFAMSSWKKIVKKEWVNWKNNSWAVGGGGGFRWAAESGESEIEAVVNWCQCHCHSTISPHSLLVSCCSCFHILHPILILLFQHVWFSLVCHYTERRFLTTLFFSLFHSKILNKYLIKKDEIIFIFLMYLELHI